MKLHLPKKGPAVRARLLDAAVQLFAMQGVAGGHIKLMTGAKFNDWGPYDYHRDFNLTFPQQFMGDASYVLGMPQWFDVPETRVGLRGTYRTLNKFSPRYCPVRVPDLVGGQECDPTYPAANGKEWELRAYLTVAW